MKPRWLFVSGSFLVLSLLLVFALRQRSGARLYAADGRIVELDAGAGWVAIDHEDIPGFMPAMTMRFGVADPALLAGLVRDDLVRFELEATSDDLRIRRLRKTGHAPGTHPAAAPPGALSLGEELPQVTLEDEDGRTVTLTKLRGAPFAVTFIFTRCPLVEFCPRFTGNFAAVQQRLGTRFPGRFRLLSVTIDPAYDRPAILKRYAAAHGADPRIWSFLTGAESEIRRIADACGVGFWTEGGSVNHTAACAVVDSSGRLYKLYRGTGWTAEEVIMDLAALLGQEAGAS
jgi:protein SCO1/2